MPGALGRVPLRKCKRPFAWGEEAFDGRHSRNNFSEMLYFPAALA